MKILLLQNVEKIGSKGDVLIVKNGYAKNYLIPKGYATSNLQTIHLTQNSYKKNNKSIEDENTIIIPVKKKNEQEIYGAINSNKISKIIKKLKLKINIKHLPENLNITKFSNYKLELNDKNFNHKTNLYIMLIDTK